MDLHAWITQQVDAVEAAARAELECRRVVLEPHSGGPAITGIVTGVTQTPDGMQLDIAQYGVEPRDETPAPVQSVAAVLRRCEADRRILNRHRIDPAFPAFPGACEGCGLDDWGLPNIESVNDCPELLDLAHAHGLTDETLASLDRPQPGEPCTRMQAAPAQTGIRGLAHVLGVKPITTSQVPAALRGPRWKP
ncbi:hypothetical protein ACFU5D_16515 [Streptomyces anthocyanicus]|uniref:hypothetical protein n=1 Tax=Streptomyces anthocyanicus TaxID=68174 RepID=UPI0036BB4759